ncbi:hypothetical protein FN846DRAFT_972310 [Sphaerosporella brunnea]|uniref:Uncharacterized protein n=1 Tax=Sphaerosporella brunnea TaxID=1250544 RepID=A0A5J5EJH3_9PEZI|nr:hypothetical protein FN846DRAFT_972310 [Sphaerosporella brunnea]
MEYLHKTRVNACRALDYRKATIAMWNPYFRGYSNLQCPPRLGHSNFPNCVGPPLSFCEGTCRHPNLTHALEACTLPVRIRREISGHTTAAYRKPPGSCRRLGQRVLLDGAKAPNGHEVLKTFGEKAFSFEASIYECNGYWKLHRWLQERWGKEALAIRFSRMIIRRC